MKLNFNVSQDIDEIKGIQVKRRVGEKHKIIERFIKSRQNVAKVEWKSDYKNAASCVNCLRTEIREMKQPVKVISRNREVHLVKEVSEC